MVDPTGSTKLATSSSTPRFFSTLSIVTGKVAELELVLNPNNIAGRIALKKVVSFMSLLNILNKPE